MAERCGTTLTMPSDAWIKERVQSTYWLTKEEHQRFAVACREKGLTKASAIRSAVLAMLEHVGEASHVAD